MRKQQKKKKKRKKKGKISVKRLQAAFEAELPRAYAAFFESDRPAAFDGLVVKGEELFFDEDMLVWAFDGGTYDENTFFFDGDQLRYLPFATYAEGTDEEGCDGEGGLRLLAADTSRPSLPIVKIEVSDGEVIVVPYFKTLNSFEKQVSKQIDTALDPEALFQQGKFDQVIAALQKAAPDYPKNRAQARTLYLLSAAYLKSGKPQKALNAARRAASVAGEEVFENRALRALALLVNGRLDEATGAYLSLKQKFGEAEIGALLSDLEAFERTAKGSKLETAKELKQALLGRSDSSQDLSLWWKGLPDKWKAIFKDAAQLRAAPRKAGLEKIRSLSELSVSGTLDNLEPLRALTDLKTLRCSDTYLYDDSALAALTKLQELDLSGINIFSGTKLLEGLTELRRLDLSTRNISSLAFLKKLKALVWLDVSQTSIQDLSPLASCKKLTTLRTSYCDMRTLAPLSGLSLLEELVVVGCPELKSLAGIKSCTKLRRVDFSNTKVSSLSFAKKLGCLEEINFSKTPVSSLEPLMGLERLTVCCDKTKVTAKELRKVKKARPGWSFVGLDTWREQSSA